jgi:hypothetical protein
MPLPLLLRSKAFYQAASGHRGGWRAVLDSLSDDYGLVNLDRPSKQKRRGCWRKWWFKLERFMQPTWSPCLPRSIDLVDSIEEWFLWGPRSVIRDTQWIGIAHWTVAADLPRHLHQSALDRILLDERFYQSSRYCVALVVMTHSLAVLVQDILSRQGLDIPVCVVHHPVAIATNTTLTFDPVIDLPIVLSNASSVVLLGQQYRRVASIHKLQTSRRKAWLPGIMHPGHLWNMLQNELPADNVTIADESVQTTRLDNHTDFDTFVRQNIIVLDLWAAVANNAILECLALQIPCLIRKLDGPVEYLGADYPLFFTTLDQVQASLDDEVVLSAKMLAAHFYLRNRDTSAYTVERMGRQIVNCTVTALQNRRRYSRRAVG